MNFRFSDKKNRQLAEIRGITFEDVIEAIAEHGVLAEFENPNKQDYPNQRIMVINVNNYSYCVPFSINGGMIERKTVYPSRKFKHLISGEKNG
jgi:uncharacterized DUF497 family protein